MKARFEKITNFIFDRIWSYHICGLIFFLFSLITIATYLYLVIPVWIFAPQKTSCLILSNSIQYNYIGSTYVTFKKYRAVIGVNYTLNGQVVSTNTYGPTDDVDTDITQRGYGLSKFLTQNFLNQYPIGSYVTCYYGYYLPSIVSFQDNPYWNFVVLLPMPFLLITLICCLLPTIYSRYWKQKRDNEYLKDFMLFDAKRSQQRELEKKCKQEEIIET